MPTAQLFPQSCCSGVTPLETLERIRPRHLEIQRVQMMTGGKLTLSRKERGKAKVKTNIREEIARPARPTRALQTSTRAKIVANLDIGRKIAGILFGGGAYDNSAYRNTGKGKSKNTSKGKGKHVELSKQNNFSLLKQPQPCRILRKIRVLLENSRACWV